MRRRNVARYEAHVAKLDNRSGFIDLFWPGVLLVEQKSAGRDLRKAYEQAGEYFDALPERERPRFILVSDFQTFELHDLDERQAVAFPLADIPSGMQDRHRTGMAQYMRCHVLVSNRLDRLGGRGDVLLEDIGEAVRVLITRPRCVEEQVAVVDRRPHIEPLIEDSLGFSPERQLAIAPSLAEDADGDRACGPDRLLSESPVSSDTRSPAA